MNGQWTMDNGKYVKELYQQHDTVKLVVERDMEKRVYKWSVIPYSTDEELFSGEEKLIEVAFLNAAIHGYMSGLSDEEWY